MKLILALKKISIIAEIELLTLIFMPCFCNCLDNALNSIDSLFQFTIVLSIIELLFLFKFVLKLILTEYNFSFLTKKVL